MSSDDFCISNLHKMKLVLSYVFQLRKQGGKYFFRHVRTCFFLEIFLKNGRFAFLKKKSAKLPRKEGF